MIKIPFKLVGGIMLISASANGKEGYFAFDTGAMQTAVNKTHFPEIEGEHINIAKYTEGVKENAAEEGTLNSLRISDIEREDMSVLIMDLMYVEDALKPSMPELKFLGTLGIDVIRNYTVLLDYSAAEIILDPEIGFENETSVHMRFENLPIIEVEAAGRKCSFALDTGASICLLGENFRDDPQLVRDTEKPNIFVIPAIRVGENEYENISAVISDISAIKKKVPVDGVVGYQVLSPQRSILDFRNNRVIMEKE